MMFYKRGRGRPKISAPSKACAGCGARFFRLGEPAQIWERKAFCKPECEEDYRFVQLMEVRRKKKLEQQPALPVTVRKDGPEES